MTTVLSDPTERPALMARNIVQSLRLHLPIDPIAVARQHRIMVIHQPPGGPAADAHLIFDRKTRRWIIVVNQRCADRKRQRFSIAHELGHYFLHQTKVLMSAGDDINLDPTVEAEANRFAAELLMPLDLVRQYMYFPLPVLTFQVSEAAWLNRLRQLGFRV